MWFFILFTLFFSWNSKSSEIGISFWNSPRKGANIFNKIIKKEDIQAAKNFNIQFVRLCPDKFPSEGRDFLIGNADNYKEISQKDLKHLKEVLDAFHAAQLPVVLTMLSLPGSRWRQNNNGQDDLRLWTDKNFQNQAIKFWKDLVKELKDHPAIVGFNILNEPHPERIYNSTAQNIHFIEQEKVQNKLFEFYNSIIEEIRKIDPHTPIIVDSSSYGNPNTFKELKPLNFRGILYSFHMYEPYTYTALKINKGRFSYPGKVEDEVWNKNKLRDYMKAVTFFQKKHNISSHHILVGEFGGNRHSKGLSTYFKDLIDIFRKQQWHFAIYAFREDTWDGMDYELGTKKLPWSYWKDIEEGKTPALKREDNSLFNIVKSMWS